MRGVCAWSVCCGNISIHQQHSRISSTAAVFQDLAFVPAVVVYYVWLVHSMRSNYNRYFAFSATIKNT